jgi:hypothetical protein
MKIEKNKPLKVKWVKEVTSGVGDRIFLCIGWVAMAPFILSELVIEGFKWIKRKIKKKGR